MLKPEFKADAAGESRIALIMAPPRVTKSRLLLQPSAMAVAIACRLLGTQGQNDVGLTPPVTVTPALQQCVGFVRDDQLPAVSLSGLRILFADNAQANRELFSHTLRAVGAVYRMQDDDQAAVDALRNESFDVILMDIRMPVLDGASVVRMLRDQGVERPVLALTANGMPEDEKRCRSVGCTGYLTKPISMNALLQATVDHLTPSTIAAAARMASAVVSLPKLLNPAN